MAEWHKNIPPQGTLCKSKDDGEIVRALWYDEESDLVTSDKTDFEGDKTLFYTYDLAPLTAAEIWQFMPWQPMGTAPKDGSEFTAYSRDKGMVCTAYYDNEDDCFFTDWRGKGNYHSVYDFVWIPLPKLDL